MGKINSISARPNTTPTAYCEPRPLSVGVVPAVMLPIACNSHHGLQQFKGMSVTGSDRCFSRYPSHGSRVSLNMLCHLPL